MKKHNIYYELQGEGEKIVILHGWGCNHEHMQPVVQHLADQYEVMNINLPGSGESKWSGQKSIDEIADSLIDVIPDNAIYLGWSFGGSIAASIAARYREKVKRIIGVTTTPKFVEANDWPGVPQPGFKVNFSIYTDDEFKALLKGFIDAEYQYFAEKPESYNQLAQINQETKPRDLNVLRDGVDIIDATDMRAEYKKISCQIDLILGAKDESIPGSVYSKIEMLNPKINIHVIDKAQHMPFWTHQNEFFKILDTILEA